jgi:hypothetical protein
MRISRKLVAWTIGPPVALSLLVFFFPKNAGHEAHVYPGPQAWQIGRVKHDCTGFIRRVPPLGSDSPDDWQCFGWVGAPHCYLAVPGPHQPEAPNCAQPHTVEEILNICPDCYPEAAAVAAMHERDLPRATSLCRSARSGRSNRGSTTPLDDCLNTVAQWAATDSPFELEQMCVVFQHEEYRDRCVGKVTALQFRTDFEGAIERCGTLGRGHSRELCLLDLARSAWMSQRFDDAQSLCGMLPRQIR